MAEGGKLTDRAVRAAKQGFYGDGLGLWLVVSPTGMKSWAFRYKINKRAHMMGLGSYLDVSLAEAREMAREARKLAKRGTDPIQHRRTAREAAKAAVGRSFRDIAGEYVESHRTAWSNPKHAAQWTATLVAYAYPVIGSMPVAEIGLSELLRVLTPIWKTKSETASRVRGRIEAVLDYATVHGWRHGENPARWKGYLAEVLPPKSKVAPVKHHAALAWLGAPAFWSDVSGLRGIAAICLRFVMLTAARSGEARGAIWTEINFDQRVWTIPRSRMKAKREHRVPLAEAALQLLEEVRPLAKKSDSLIFPGGRPDKALSDAALAKVLGRVNYSDLTVHGLRSCFRDWVAEATAFQPELAEAALAHTVRNKVEAAYQRGDMLERRREVMDAWATYCTSLPTIPAAR